MSGRDQERRIRRSRDTQDQENMSKVKITHSHYTAINKLMNILINDSTHDICCHSRLSVPPLGLWPTFLV